MMKKVYIAPVTEIAGEELETMICSSIVGIGGDSGLELGTGDAPTSADSRLLDFIQSFQN